MPTPNDACEHPVSVVAHTSNPSCPPEHNRVRSRIPSTHSSSAEYDASAALLIPRSYTLNGSQEHVADAPVADASTMEQAQDSTIATSKADSLAHEDTICDSRSQSPSSHVGDVKDESHAPIATRGRSPVASLQSSLSVSGYPSTRLRPTYSSSFLRAGSKFVGTQQSDKQIYNVEVTIKNVDLKESFLCGFLKIEGLTPDHPTLTTYFESEIIGPKYTFKTKHESWGATEKTDMQHWDRFPAWRPIAKEARKPDFHYKNSTERESVFMRWKEYFLVPDHRVREISGASFEGFYYICFNQAQGTISGIYFHARSEKYQQLELRHVPDRGCFGAFEFR